MEQVLHVINVKDLLLLLIGSITVKRVNQIFVNNAEDQEWDEFLTFLNY